jgi:hypothetical protein
MWEVNPKGACSLFRVNDVNESQFRDASLRRLRQSALENKCDAMEDSSVKLAEDQPEGVKGTNIGKSFDNTPFAAM